MTYSKNDLLFTYEWTRDENDPILKGLPQQAVFNKNEGWEVLYLINQFCRKNKAEVMVIAYKAEKMIRNHLPETVKTQKAVMEWLQQNWSQY